MTAPDPNGGWARPPRPPRLTHLSFHLTLRRTVFYLSFLSSVLIFFFDSSHQTRINECPCLSIQRPSSKCVAPEYFMSTREWSRGPRPGPRPGPQAPTGRFFCPLQLSGRGTRLGGRPGDGSHSHGTAATARIAGPNGGSRTRPAGSCPALCLCCLFRTFQGAIYCEENLCFAIVRGVKTFSNVNGVLEPERLNRPSGVSSTFVHGRLSLS